MSAFRAFDIRGIYPNEIDEKLAYTVGRAATIYLKAKTATIGRDCRTTSPALTKSLIYGLTDQGCNVLDIGYCNTPMCYYAAQKTNALMITASHNPKEYNGIKITKKGVEQIGDSNGLKEIEKLTNNCHFPEPTKKGTVKQKNLLPEYTAYVRKLVNGKYKPLRVLIDCGNGMAGHVVPELMKGLPIKYELLYGTPDGNFPNHTPNPAIPENTAELQQKVVKENYDLGIAYDADCDRVFFIDEKGNRIRSEHVLILLAQKLMKKGESAVYTVNMSKILAEEIQKQGGKAIPSKIGHTELPLTMKKHKSTIAGEISGHFYYKKFKYADSGDITALMMLSIISQSGKKLSELIKPYQKYATEEELNYKVENKEQAIERIEKEYKQQITQRLDGLNIDAGDYWFNVRLSRTENLVRLCCEAKTKQALENAIRKISKLIGGERH